MLRTAWLLFMVLAILGCQPAPNPPPRKTSSTTSAKPAPQVTRSDHVEPQTTDPKPDQTPKDSDPTTVDTTETPAVVEDKELEALKALPVEELVAQLREEKDRSLATRALAARGKEAVAPLVKALDDEDPQVRAAAAFTLGQLGDDAAEAKDRLKQVAESDENEVAKDAATFALEALEGS